MDERSDVAPALTKAGALEILALPGALEGISDADRAKILNFNVPLR